MSINATRVRSVHNNTRVIHGKRRERERGGGGWQTSVTSNCLHTVFRVFAHGQSIRTSSFHVQEEVSDTRITPGLQIYLFLVVFIFEGHCCRSSCGDAWGREHLWRNRPSWHGLWRRRKIVSPVPGVMVSIRHYFARKQVGDAQKRGKPEMRSSCRKSLDLHWSASAQPGRGPASVPHLSVSRRFNE